MEKISQIQRYLNETYLFTLTSQLINFQLVDKQTQKDKYLVLRLLLKENIFHPQGGGQPNDTGLIKVFENQYPVHDLFYDRTQNLVYLEVKDKAQELNQLLLEKPIQDILIEQNVEAQSRKLNARIHSAGHLIDIAVSNIGLKWVPGKGYHFNDAPYVEYIGSVDGLNLDNIRQQIEDGCKAIIEKVTNEDLRKIVLLTPNQYQQKTGQLPEYLKQVETIRYVQLCQEDQGCPCGGTHVEHIKEIVHIKVTKVQKKGKNLRVAYQVA